MIQFISGDSVSNLTKTAGTRIQSALGGLQGNFVTHVASFTYTPGTTVHNITLMRGQSRDKVAGSVAAAGTTVITVNALLDALGAAPVSGGVVTILLDNGQWHLSTLNGAPTNNGLTLTLNTAIPTGRTVPNGAKIVYHGVAADTFHANYIFPTTASTATQYPTSVFEVALCCASSIGEPIVIDSPNATVAGTLNNAYVGYASN